MKIKNLSKAIAAFVLSAALMAEPLAGMPAVRAEEAQAESQENIENPEAGDNSGLTENTDSEGENAGTENPGTEDGDESAGEPGTENGGAGTENPGAENGDESVDNPDTGGDNEDAEEPKDESGEETGGTSDEETGTDDTVDGIAGSETKDVNGEAEDWSGEPENKASDEESVAGQDNEETGGFSDMPAGYRLTSYQRELKAGLTEDLEQIQESDEGMAYAARRVFTFAQSKEEAEMIAEAYHAEIEDFSMGVLTLKLSEDKTVRAAVKAAAAMDNSLPAVWPDYRRELYEEVFPESSWPEDSTAELEVTEEE